MAGKYAPLEQYLHELSASQKKVTPGFEQIESILNAKPPSSPLGKGDCRKYL